MPYLTRRGLLAALPASLVATAGRAADFPTKDINFLIPFAPGGGFDSYVRTIIPGMQQALGGRVNVLPNNLEGGAGIRCANLVDRAKPDGYTMGIFNVPGILMLDGLGFDLTKLTWLSNLGRDPYGIAVAMDSPIHNVADLRKLSAERPIKFTSTGTASTGYLATRITAHLLDLREQMINGYKGTTEYVVAAVRGDGDAAVCSLTALSGFVASKLVRVIATFEKHASIPGAEDATTLSLPELTNLLQLRPVAGPRGLPAPLRDTLSGAMVSAMRDPGVQDWAKRNSANLDPMDADATTRMIQDQVAFMARWKPRLAPA
jgi:tripartite-type tricarboxylate transporter receptor subunit TctC